MREPESIAALAVARTKRHGTTTASLSAWMLCGWLLGFGSPCASAGVSEPEYEQRLGQALGEISARIPEPGRRPVEFGLNLFLAHEAWIASVDSGTLVEAVDAFKEAGVDRVEINPGQFPWLDHDPANIAKYDAAIERIRHDKLKLTLNPQYSAVWHKAKSFAAWRQTALALYAELARRYRPDTFVVVHEPSTMAARLGGRVRVADWVDFATEAARVVREASPGTRIGAGGLASEQEYFEAFARVAEIDVLTLDIYSLRDLPRYDRMIRVAKEAGKPVYIEETWRPPYYRPRLGLSADKVSLKNVGNRAFERLDGEWLRVMTAYAQANGLEAITPVWMFALFSYVDGDGNLDDPSYNRAVVEAIGRGARTATFRTLQELVRANERLRHTRPDSIRGADER